MRGGRRRMRGEGEGSEGKERDQRGRRGMRGEGEGSEGEGEG